MLRTCKRCGIEKELETEFQLSNGKWYGQICKACKNKQNKEWRKNNLDKDKAAKKKWHENNLEKVKNYMKEYSPAWVEKNREKVTENGARWYQENKERLKPIRQKWRENNVEKRRQHAKKYYYNTMENNPEVIRDKGRRFRNTPYGLLTNRIHSMIWRLLKEKKQKSSYVLGWTKEDFFSKIGIPIKGMEIDHKIPVSWFKEDTNIKLICALDNLHLISEEDNRTKGNNYSHKITQQYYNEIFNFIKEEQLNKIKYERSTEDASGPSVC